MDDTRLIKKHANRRLYDTQLKKYLSLEKVRELIAAGTDVRIEDAKTGEDITRQLLLQIIAECEQGDQPMLSSEMLMALIRHYGHPMQDVVGRYLEHSLAFYLRQEARLRQRMTDMLEPMEFGKGEGFAAMRESLIQVLKSGKRD